MKSQRSETERDKLIKEKKMMKLLNKMKKTDENMKIEKENFFCINEMSKMDLCCIKCLKVKKNSANID